MEGVVGLVVIVVGGYIGWKILCACFSGLQRAGNSITENWPRHFEKVWTSIITGLMAGFVMGIFTGGNMKITSAGAGGVALAKFVWGIIRDETA